MPCLLSVCLDFSCLILISLVLLCFSQSCLFFLALFLCLVFSCFLCVDFACLALVFLAFFPDFTRPYVPSLVFAYLVLSLLPDPCLACLDLDLIFRNVQAGNAIYICLILTYLITSLVCTPCIFPCFFHKTVYLFCMSSYTPYISLLSCHCNIFFVICFPL